MHFRPVSQGPGASSAESRAPVDSHAPGGKAAAKPPSIRYPTVDSLRGFAALAIVLSHFTSSGLPKVAVPEIGAFFTWGWYRVHIFFVISGFIVPLLLVRSGYRLADAATFLERRVIRVAIPAWIALALTILQIWVAVRWLGADAAYWGPITPERLLANFSFTAPLVGEQLFNGVYWTLTVEVQFYLVLALMTPVIFRSARNFTLAAGILAALSFTPPSGTFRLMEMGSIFLMGGTAAMYAVRRMERIPALALLAVLLGTAALRIGFIPAAVALATALAIMFVRVRIRPLLFLGTISFSLFLVHPAVGSTAEYVLIRLFPPAGLGSRLAIIAACVALAIAAAWVFYQLVEKPCADWSRRIAARRPTPLLDPPATP